MPSGEGDLVNAFLIIGWVIAGLGALGAVVYLCVELHLKSRGQKMPAHYQCLMLAWAGLVVAASNLCFSLAS